MTDLTTLQLELEQLKKENQELKAKKATKSSISFKVSEKGAVSIYGLGRFPVTLYKSQALRLIEKCNDLKAFIEQHPELKEKDAA